MSRYIPLRPTRRDPVYRPSPLRPFLIAGGICACALVAGIGVAHGLGVALAPLMAMVERFAGALS